jgi:TRAP-type C4-dicarboxylate transport system substrate-binding protein
MKGIKIRLPQIQSWIDIFKEVGAAPTPIAATEIVTALKTGTVDGQENFLTNIAGRQMWEYQKYLIATKHVSLPQTWLVSEKVFQKLSADQKQWLEQAIKDAIAFERPQVEQLNAGFIKQCIDKGMTLIEPDRDAFVKAAQPAIDKTLKGMAPGVQEAAQAAIKGK